MKELMFNIHDLVLALFAGECFLIALILMWGLAHKHLSQRLLMVLALLNGMIATNVLIQYGAGLRTKAFDVSPDLFFIFAFASFLQGPVLFWYTLSLLKPSFELGKKAMWHLLPTLLTPPYLYFLYYRHSTELKRKLALDFEMLAPFPGNFNWFITLQKFITLGYGFYCVYLLSRQAHSAQHPTHSAQKADMQWLKLLLGSFLFVWIWSLLIHLSGFTRFYTYTFGDTMGIITNYLACGLLNGLLVYRLLHANTSHTPYTTDSAEEPARDPLRPDYIEKVIKAMDEDKLFMNSRLTLEDFSTRIGVPSRQVSAIINRHLNQNFHEFVNKHRVDEAKRILSDLTNQQQNVMEIATTVGFNSKPAFNRFFKKFTGLTPSEYRDQTTRSLS